MGNSFEEKEVQKSLAELKRQAALVVEAVRKNPSKKREILLQYVSYFYEAVKKTIRKRGSVMPHHVILADIPELGLLSTDEMMSRAKALKAEAVVYVEGFQSDDDIGEAIYHVSMSAPCIGVLGWVLKMKHGERTVDIIREMPYLFDSQDKVKTLGQLITEMEGEGGSLLS